MAIKINNIEFYAGPKKLGGPDDLLKVIVDFIDGAKKKLEIAVQELDSEDIAQAIVRARQRKVVVKIVLEGHYLTVTKAVETPFKQTGENEANRQIQNAVLRAKIDLKSDYNPAIFHQKFIIRDGASVLTGSTNFTDTGTHANLNHIVIVHDRGVAKEYRTEFKEIQQGRFGKLSVGHDPAPKIVDVDGIPVKSLFAPDHSPEMEIMKLICKAKERIDFAIFTFAQSSGIDDALISRSMAGLPVRGVMDRMQANQKWAATHPMQLAGVDLYITEYQAELGKLHHKLMVIDRQVIIAGSFNYTGAANTLNDENIMVIGSLSTVDAEARKNQRRLARFALKEIDRMIKDHTRKVSERPPKRGHLHQVRVGDFWISGRTRGAVTSLEKGTEPVIRVTLPGPGSESDRTEIYGEGPTVKKGSFYGITTSTRWIGNCGHTDRKRKFEFHDKEHKTPQCQIGKIKQKSYFKSKQEAEDYGYDPCHYCRPGESER